MQIVHVHVSVKPESVEAFKQATVENATNSMKEAGIARFDVIQQSSSWSKFIKPRRLLALTKKLRITNAGAIRSCR